MSKISEYLRLTLLTSYFLRKTTPFALRSGPDGTCLRNGDYMYMEGQEYLSVSPCSFEQYEHFRPLVVYV